VVVISSIERSVHLTSPASLAGSRRALPRLVILPWSVLAMWALPQRSRALDSAPPMIFPRRHDLLPAVPELAPVAEPAALQDVLPVAGCLTLFIRAAPVLRLGVDQ
jgi:hypothetical protein